MHGFIFFFEDEALSLGRLDGTAQPLDLFFHLGVFGALPDTLEVGLDLAFELEAVTSGAALEGFLHHIAPELLETNNQTG